MSRLLRSYVRCPFFVFISCNDSILTHQWLVFWCVNNFTITLSVFLLLIFYFRNFFHLLTPAKIKTAECKVIIIWWRSAHNNCCAFTFREKNQMCNVSFSFNFKIIYCTMPIYAMYSNTTLCAIVATFHALNDRIWKVFRACWTNGTNSN